LNFWVKLHRFIFLLVLLLPGVTEGGLLKICLVALEKAVGFFSEDLPAQPPRGNAQASHWLIENPELQQTLEKARVRFLSLQEESMKKQSQIPKPKSVQMNGKEYPVVQVLGAGGGGDGVVKDGNQQKILKRFWNKDRMDSHFIGLTRARAAGVPALRMLERDDSTLTVEMEPIIGIPVNELIGYKNELGLSIEQTRFIEHAYRTQFENSFKGFKAEEQNVLLDIRTGRFYLFDPH
jgi:hypothetical protein